MPMPDPRGSPYTLKQLRNWAEVFLVFPLETTRILFSLSFLSESRVASGSGHSGRDLCQPAQASSTSGVSGPRCPESLARSAHGACEAGHHGEGSPTGVGPSTASRAICLLPLQWGGWDT